MSLDELMYNFDIIKRYARRYLAGERFPDDNSVLNEDEYNNILSTEDNRMSSVKNEIVELYSDRNELLSSNISLSVKIDDLKVMNSKLRNTIKVLVALLSASGVVTALSLLRKRE